MDARVGIVGLGYVGLPLALTAAENEWHVTGYDINVSTINKLNSGQSHIDGIPNVRLETSLREGRLVLTESAADLKDLDICIICVPTPTNDSHEPDLSFIISACEAIAPFLKKSCVLVNESTSFPGTLRNVIQKTIRERRGAEGDLAGYVSAPERVDPGNPVYDHSNTPRVLGGDNPHQVERVRKFYASLGPDVFIVSSPEAAELSKLVENAFRLVNISFINELAPYTSKLGIDLMEVVSAAATKPFGFMKFTPGPGVGGHCIPVDPHYLVKSADEKQLRLKILDSAIAVNLEVPGLVVDKILNATNLKANSKLLLIGVAYKQGIADTRESPALEIARAIVRRGHEVYWIDDQVHEWPHYPRFTDQEIELAIALTSSTSELVSLVSNKVQVIDCTGQFSQMNNVKSYFQI